MTNRPTFNPKSPYVLVDKHPAYEVHQSGLMVARYPNRADALAAMRRFNKADRRAAAKHY